MTVNSSRVFVIVSTLLACAMPVFGRDNRFPRELLQGKTIAVVSHYGLTSIAHNLIREEQFKTSAEAILRASHQFTVVDDPAKADLVLLLVGGYSEGFLGKKSHIATGLVFSGGAAKGSNGLPLWVSMQTSGIRTHAAAAVVSKALLKEVDKALQREPATSGESPKDENAEDSASLQTEPERPVTEEMMAGPLPQEIFSAKKVMVILRIDTVPDAKGERREKAVEKELHRWGRYKVVDKPSDADMFIVCIRYLDSGLYSSTVFENMLVFPAGNPAPKWGSLPLWTALAVDAPLFGASAGTQEVRWLRKRMEQQASMPLTVHAVSH